MILLEQIMNILKDRELTSLEIASEINIPKDNCSSYLNTLYKDGRIERISDKRPFKYKIPMKPIELLKRLYDLMDSKMKFEKKAVNKDIELIKQVELVIK